MTPIAELVTYEELKGHAATLGMVLFGLKYKKTVPRLEKHLRDGVVACHAIARGTSLLKSGRMECVEDLVLADAFSSISPNRMTDTEQIANLGAEAEAVGGILERLTAAEEVSQVDLERSYAFFNRLYVLL